MTVNDGARLWIDDVLIIDQYDNEVPDDQSAAVFSAPSAASLVAGRLVAIKIEFRYVHLAYSWMGVVKYTTNCL